ncbi:MAG: hypothetical protein DME25_11385 [Verrucomicrobia bacterium]|nr:MAG: hypothetical protein DME25_11385 [Verrucomicrobiota bacterium]
MLQIEEVTRQIEKDPRNPELYLKRGELRRLHVEWDAAYADYQRASALAPDWSLIDLARGRLFLDSGWPLSARAVLDRFLIHQPNHVEALILRARALARLNLRLAAAQDYSRAIRFSPEPGPDLFIERAQVLAAEGSAYFSSALRGLDEGIQKLGPLVTLQLFAVDVELKQKNIDGALARLDKVAEKSPRKETWLARRGEILQQAGRPEEARQAFKAALASFQTLPPTRRNVPAMLELERRLRRQLELIDANPAR